MPMVQYFGVFVTVTAFFLGDSNKRIYSCIDCWLYVNAFRLASTWKRR